MKKEMSLLVAEGVVAYEKGLADLLVDLIGESERAKVTELLSSTDINKVGTISIPYLKQFGFSLAKAKKLQSTFGFAVRLQSVNQPSNLRICSPQTAYEVFSYLKFENQEHFVVAALNTKNQVIAKKTIFKGSLNVASVHPREIFNFAIEHSAATILVAHNHPSTDPSPSRGDIEFTRRLVKSGEIIGIDITDHIIVGGERFCSLKEGGYL